MPKNVLAKKLGKKALFALYIAVLVIIGAQLFFGDQISFFVKSFKPDVERPIMASIQIGYAFAPKSLEPTRFDPVTRSHLVDIYEGLVRTDRNLRIEPAVALSWGLLDPLTWEFKLRPNVLFHNGELVTTEDVVASLDRARTFEQSHLRDLLGTIESVKKIDSGLIHVTTKDPDPLLLNKLAVAYIFPADHDDFETPVGTGPYTFAGYEEGHLILKRFENYWGKLPRFSDVKLKSFPNRRERIKALEAGEIDLLTNVPPNVACSVSEKYADFEGCNPLKKSGLKFKSIPSLEVSFIIFNFNNSVFRDIKIRENLKKALDPQFFVDLVFGFARPVSQFVSSGVFGFNPEIEKVDYDIESARAEISAKFEEAFERIEVTFDYPEELDAIAFYVQNQFGLLGIDVSLNALSGAELESKIRSGESDFYYLGWRSELGDSSDFLVSTVHSRDRANRIGLLNGGNYLNKEVDDLIEWSQKELETAKRLQTLQEAMQIAVEDDLIGIPLFESEIIYAFSEELNFEPRVDGSVLVSEIR